MQWLSQRDVTPIGQWSDNEPLSAPEELVLVNKIHVGDLNGHLIHLRFEVEAELFEPLEIGDRAHGTAAEQVEYVALVDVDGDERFEFDAF